MAKITKEQFNKFNAELKNGFRFDLNFFLTWNEKRATKKIELENNKVLKINLEYYDNSRYIQYKKISGADLVISFSVWEPSGDLYVSYGIGTKKVLISGLPRKEFKRIQAESENWNNDKCLELFKEISKNENWSLYA